MDPREDGIKTGYNMLRCVIVFDPFGRNSRIFQSQEELKRLGV